MIRLSNIRFVEGQNTPQEWKLDGLYLGETNLIVGKNASGKSRTLNIIHSLAKKLAGKDRPSLSGNYDVEFNLDGKVISYRLRVEERQVVEEVFSLDGRILLERGDGGEGLIWAEEIDGGTKIRFQVPTSELAVVARRDTIQHKFLEPLYSWGSSLHHYYFGTALGKDRFAIFTEGEADEKIDGWNPDVVVALYKQAENEFPDSFAQILMQDMQQLGYDIIEVGVKPPISIQIASSILGGVYGLYVKEKDLPGITDQHSMSQGMFRALSLLVQVNYSQMSDNSTCILIDDIGEGLDFDRSCRLIDLLREKTKTSHIQLVLSTNDRFVMNRVPLEEWSVLQRKANYVRVLNYGNSSHIFEEFKFTGLSNFSFLEMDFANEPQTNGVAEYE